MSKQYTYSRTIWVSVNAKSLEEADNLKADAWAAIGNALDSLNEQLDGPDCQLEDVEDEEPDEINDEEE